MKNNPIDMRKKNSCPYLNPSYKDLEQIFIAQGIKIPVNNLLDEEEEKKDVDQEKIIKENFIINYPEDKFEEYNIYNIFMEKKPIQVIISNVERLLKIKFIKKILLKIKTDDKKQNLFKITIEKNKENEFPEKGRRKKDKFYPPKSDKKIVHDKFWNDNIIQKIKIHFLKEARNYVNSEYKKYFKKKYPKGKYRKLIKMTERNYENYLNNKNKQAFLLIKLSDILSGKVSNRYSNEIDKINYNKKNIEKLIEEGEPKNLVDFISKTMEDTYEIYIREGENKIQEFNFENDLCKIKDEINGKGESYKEKYKNIAKDLLKIINNK